MSFSQQVGLLLLLVAGDVELGIRLQERAAIRAQLLVREFLLDHSGIGRRGRDRRFPTRFGRLLDVLIVVRECTSALAIPRFSSGMSRATLPAISFFQP